MRTLINMCICATCLCVGVHIIYVKYKHSFARPYISIIYNNEKSRQAPTHLRNKWTPTAAQSPTHPYNRTPVLCVVTFATHNSLAHPLARPLRSCCSGLTGSLSTPAVDRSIKSFWMKLQPTYICSGVYKNKSKKAGNQQHYYHQH